MRDNYCFRRKQHSYAACDAALAASNNYKTYHKEHKYINTNDIAEKYMTCTMK